MQAVHIGQKNRNRAKPEDFARFYAQSTDTLAVGTD